MSSNPHLGIVLASASPRRAYMFAELNIPVEIIPADIDETPLPMEAPRDFAMRLAGEKGLTVATTLLKAGRRPFVISADTVVMQDDHLMGKPRDAQDAQQMLSRLAGRAHHVLTAWSVGRPGDNWTLSTCVTRVHFYPLSATDIDAYVATGEYVDKAGAYAIQGKGVLLVRQIEGSFANVVGLPIADVVHTLRSLGALTNLWTS